MSLAKQLNALRKNDMNHPIYNHLTSEEIKIAMLDVEGKTDEAEERIKELIFRLKGIRVTNENRIIEFPLVVRTAVAAAVILGGHVKIDASCDGWYDETSRKTIASIPAKNFKMPFHSGSITVGKNVYIFAHHGEKLYFVLISETEEEKNSDFDISKGELPNIDDAKRITLPLCILEQDSDITVGEEIAKNNFSEQQAKEVYSLLSALMYITMSKASIEEYGDSLQTKTVVSKGKKKKGIPRHTTRVINVRQKIKKGNGKTHSRGKSDKTWIVRGHWRNQWYAKLNGHKPKWIDAYFKGDGKIAADKVYKLQK